MSVPPVVSGEPGYSAFTRRFRRAVSRAVPGDAVVAVISKGDDTLLGIGPATAWHFPRRSDGVYAGHHPADDRSAIAHLEALRGRGAQFLAVPSLYLWWLDHYAGFREHLESTCRLVVSDEEIGNLYALFVPGSRLAHRADDVDESEGSVLVDEPVLSSDRELRRRARALFDKAHYERRSGLVFPDDDAALDHYLAVGHARWDPHPLFDTPFYVRSRPQVRWSGAVPLLDFLTHGRTEPLSPNPYFDALHYAQEAGLDPGDGANALLHYASADPAAGAANPNPLFSHRYYLRENPDVVAQGLNPLVHWLTAGADSGRAVSHPHKSMLDGLARRRSSELRRGGWAARRVLVLLSGHRSARAEDPLALAERLERRPHTRAVVVWLRRPELVGRADAASTAVALDDYETVCDVMRPSAVRTFVRSLTAQQLTGAITDAPVAVPVLDAAGVPTAFLGDSMPRMSRQELEEVCAGRARVVVRRADTFLEASTRLGSPPTNVVLRPRPRPSASAAPTDPVAEFDRYAEQVIDLLPMPEDPPSAPPADGLPKVIIPCSDWSLSGVNASLEALGRQLLEMGWQVEILFTRDREYVVASAQGEEHLPALPFRFLERNRRTVEGMWSALISGLEAAAPVIVFTSYDFLANSTVPALTEQVAVVNWVQSDDGDYYEQVYRLGRYCNAIVSVSEHIKDSINELNPSLADRTHVIHNTSVWTSDVVKRKSSSRDRLRIVYAGRLVQYQKRVLDFLELAAALDERDVPYTMTLIGEFNPREGIADRFRLEALSHLADGRIVLPGRLPRNAVLDQLSAHDFFVLLSDFEGLPLSVVEAMARGCVPVTAQMASGIPEVVDSGENGLIVPERDYGKWADLLIDCWRDRVEYRRLSMNARRTVLSDFTVERAALRYDALFRVIADQMRRPGFVRPPALHWGADKSPYGDVLPPPVLHRTGQVVGLT